MTQLQHRGPAVVHAHNIMNLHDRKFFRGEQGKTLRELAPATKNAYLCVLNGDYVLPEDQDWVPGPLDHVGYIVLPKGGRASQIVLGVVLIIVGALTSWAGGGALIVAGIGLIVSGLMPVPNFTPLVEQQTTAPSPTYALSSGGNTARLGSPIPVLYGRHILIPDFASQPYAEWRSDNNQFYHALMCIGATNDFILESIQIDDTEITHFSGVETDIIYAGETRNSPLLYDVVVNAAEIANQDLLRGEYSGPFAVCGAGYALTSISIDVRLPRGLYYANDAGGLTPLSVTFFVEARKISDNNVPMGPWRLLGNETITMATNTPQTRTYTYGMQDVGGAARYEVRMSRQDVRDTNTRAGHDLQWAGMRGYFASDMPDNRASYLAVRMRATSQLSGLTQRKFAVVIQRKLRTWHPDTGWSAPVSTKSIAWALADVLTNTAYGAGLPDYRVDLQTLYELDQLWAERGDEFNGVFDKRVTVWAALTTIARAGRARPVMRGSVFTFVRDTKQELPVAMFSMRNIERGSFSVDYALRTEDEADGLELEYFDSTTWSSSTVVQPVPGVEENDVINAQTMAIMGVTRRSQAQREAAYIVADSMYRRSTVTFTTELEGYLPAYGDLIAVSHDLTGWGVSGDIEFYDEDLKQASVVEDLPWGDGDFYCILVGPQGDVYGPYRVVSGSDKRTMVFVDEPDPGADIYVGTDRERTRYAMGLASSYAKLCRVIGITPKDARRVTIKAVVEDDRVHAADAPYLGVDDGGSGSPRVARYAPAGTPAYDAASDTEQNQYGFVTRVDGTIGTNNDAGYVYSGV